MKLSTIVPGPRRTRFGIASIAAVGLLLALPGSAQAATAVPLGTADTFVVLAGAGVTNTGPTTLNGDLGTFPTTGITGVGPGADAITINGINHGGDAVTQGAKDDLVTAYNNVAAQVPSSRVPAELGGQTLMAGTYNTESNMQLTGALTLDAQGDPNAVFVFQAGSTLITEVGSQVNLINGASHCNVYWQVSSSATLGTTTAFQGTILALQSVTLTTGATVQGRVLARNGAVTLDTNTITRGACAVVPAAGAAGAAPAPGPQVVAVPSGPVSTGDGSSAGATDAREYVVAFGALALAGAGGAVMVAMRRRHQAT